MNTEKLIAAAVVALGCLGTGADGSALAAQTKADSEDVKKIENYLNSIKTMRALILYRLPATARRWKGGFILKSPIKSAWNTMRRPMC